jgi:hypothetical protein
LKLQNDHYEITKHNRHPRHTTEVEPTTPENARAKADAPVVQAASAASVSSPTNPSLPNSRWGIKEPPPPQVSSTTRLVRTSARGRWVRFELVAPEARTVFLAGSFNNWNPSAAPMMSLHDRKWAKELWLPFGRYEYLFVVDDGWIPDPGVRDRVPNPFGGRNSVLYVV